ncbi:MAG: NUDIX hydrolase [Phycisphaerae bacterium]
MPTARDTSAAGGSRDCGRFFIDIVGHYGPRDVAIQWCDARRDLPDAVLRLIERTWAEHSRQAEETKVILFDGPLCRVIDASGDEKHLSLTLGPTGYKEFLGTNLARAGLRYTHGDEALANPLGVSAAVTTADGYLLLGRRSGRVVHQAGRIHPLGGMVEPELPRRRAGQRGDGGGGAPDVFAAIRQELCQETNVSPEMVRDLVCLGLVRDKRIVQPELVFDASLAADAPTLRRLARKAPDAAEHDEMVLLMNRPSSVVTFMEKHAEILTPVATAALLLHGLRAWGSGWFASARGYLKTVV